MINTIISKIQMAILWLATPLQKLLQHLGKPEPKMHKGHVDTIKGLIRAGDVLGSYESLRPTNVLIRGDYDHLAMISSNLKVIEATGAGVGEVELEEWLYKKDKVFVARVKCDEFTAFKASATSLTYLKRGYDFLFNFFNDKVYCSELVYLSYKDLIPNFMREVARKKTQILPDDFYQFAKRGQELELLYDMNKPQ